MQFLALKEEINKENDPREMRLPNIKPKVDANMIADIDTNLRNLGKEMGAILDRMTIQVEELANTIKEQFSRQLSSDIKNDDIREYGRVNLSFEG